MEPHDKLTLEERTKRLRRIRLFIYDHEPQALDFFRALDEQIETNESIIKLHKKWDLYFKKNFGIEKGEENGNTEQTAF